MESVCHYTLRDENYPKISVKSSLDNGGLVSFLLPADKRYSTFIEMKNAVGTNTIRGPKFSKIRVHVHVYAKFQLPGVIKTSNPIIELVDSIKCSDGTDTPIILYVDIYIYVESVNGQKTTWCKRY